MRKYLCTPRIWALALVGLVGTGTARADHPLAGKWKVTVLSGGVELSPWIIQIDEDKGKFSAKLVSAGIKELSPLAFDRVAVSDKGVHLDMIHSGELLYLSAYPPKMGKGADKLIGSVLIPSGKLSKTNGVEPVRLERTDATKIDPKDVEKKGVGADELKKLDDAKSEKEAQEILRGIIKKFPDDPVALISAYALIKTTVLEGKADELKKLAEGAAKVAARFGPEMQAVVARDFGVQLAKSDKTEDLAVEMVREAMKLEPKDVPAWQHEFTLTEAARVLKAAGKDDEAKKIKGEIAKLGPALDAEFKKTAIPFTPEPFKGRKGSSKRVALVELFTGATCPPCVAADSAFDALLKTYKPGDVVLLQYHLHIPSPDPLTNPDGDKRSGSAYYDIPGTPAVFVNGKEVQRGEGEKAVKVGGPKYFAQAGYDMIREDINKQLEEPAAVDLTLKATRDGDVIALEAEAGKSKKAGKKTRLRFALVEDVVHYPGSNGQRFHHHVVRGMPGGADGIALPPLGGVFKQKVDLKKLKLGLIDYLAEQSKDKPFPGDQRPLELKNLKAVAFIQNDDTKEVLNAAQVDVPAK